MKRLLSVALICVMLLCLVACGGDDGVPSGMKLASNKNIVSYSLFVPEDWIIDEQSAMTMAHVSTADKSSVSVMQWNLTEETKTIDLWWESYHKKEISEAFNEFTVIKEGEECIVDSKAAKSYTFTVKINGFVYKYYVVAVINQGSIHVITYTSTDEGGLYEQTLPVVKDQIIANFRFN